LVVGCAGSRGDGGRFEPAGDAECRSLDSAFALSGWHSRMELTGKVKLDVKQYRVQGRFRADFSGEGNFTFEFAGTMVMGGHHEDVVVSFHDGELYVLDRERGRLYEGEETNRLIRDGLGTDWDMVDLVRRITAWPPPCQRLSLVEVQWRGDDAGTVKGRVDGDAFRAEFDDGVIVNASWPLASTGQMEDRLSLDYRWRIAPDGRQALKELVGFVEGRRWRLILEVE